MLGDHKGVELGLGPVRWVFRDLVEVGLGGLDFLDEHGVVFDEQAVDAAAYFEGNLVGFDQIRDGHFRLIVGGAGALDLLVAARAFH